MRLARTDSEPGQEEADRTSCGLRLEVIPSLTY